MPRIYIGRLLGACLHAEDSRSFGGLKMRREDRRRKGGRGLDIAARQVLGFPWKNTNPPPSRARTIDVVTGSGFGQFQNPTVDELQVAD